MNKMVKTKVNGKYPLVVQTDRAPFLQNWEAERTDSIMDNVRSDSIVYSVGSELGDLSCLFGLGAPDGGVYLFEPSQHYFVSSREIFEANDIKPLGWFVGFLSNIDDLNPPNKDVFDKPQNDWPAAAYREYPDYLGFRHLAQETDATPQVTMDTFVYKWGNRPPTIIEIDTEGSEYNILLGSREVLAEYKPIVYVSIHPQFLKDMYDKTENDVYDLMECLGYKHKLLAHRHEKHEVFYHPEGRGIKL